MSNKLPKIENDVQDRNSIAWQKLCEYIDKVAMDNTDEFLPRKALGNQLFSEIYTLPESISKLKKVKKVGLYGSQLKRLPPEIGEMEALEYLDPYTSYNLNWFPYEITNCKHLKDSRVSTRALFGNYKNRMKFPNLTKNPVKYCGETVKCSVCKQDMTYDKIQQLWITLEVGTDVLPLLANLCSKECEEKLPEPAKGYVKYPHKGGARLKQPSYEEWEKESGVEIITMTLEELEKQSLIQKNEPIKPLKLIRNIWEK
jgi:hypothetical protein